LQSLVRMPMRLVGVDVTFAHLLRMVPRVCLFSCGLFAFIWTDRSSHTSILQQSHPEDSPSMAAACTPSSSSLIVLESVSQKFGHPFCCPISINSLAVLTLMVLSLTIQSYKRIHPHGFLLLGLEKNHLPSNRHLLHQQESQDVMPLIISGPGDFGMR